MDYSLSNHAKNELINRQIPLNLLEKVLNEPQQIVKNDFDTLIYQSVLTFPNEKQYLLRIVLIEKEPVHIITLYRTSKISKYWRNDNEN